MNERSPADTDVPAGMNRPVGTARSKPPADIDDLIRWVAQQRQHSPDCGLRELLDADSIPETHLVELACVDLIGQRRGGKDLMVEDYLHQFETIADNEEQMLDLIDAEMCVRREMGDRRDAEFFVQRFPKHADAIRQLLFLEAGPEIAAIEMRDADRIAVASESTGETTAELSCETPGQALGIAGSWESCPLRRDMKLPGRPRKTPKASLSSGRERTDDSIEVPVPIRPPEWLAGARCIATAPSKFGRCWLIIGRDIQRGAAVAMKVIPLPASVATQQRSKMLDLCEQTGNVIHPVWVPPRIAAINNGHLAVIRPWIFGTPLHQMIALSEADKLMRDLARVAFTLSAAHQIGATHGSVSAPNMIVDHESNVMLVDPASGVRGWIDYLAIWTSDLTASLPARIRLDTLALLRVIACQCIDQCERGSAAWIGLLADGIDPSQPDACAEIGERLLSFLDQPPAVSKSRWWRR